jgi:hypothetical protein
MSEFITNYAAFSPEGNWIAYESYESGSPEVYIHSTRGSDKQRVSANGGSHPKWRGDGKEIFYVTSDNKMMAANVRLGQSLTVSPAQMLFPVCNARRSDSIFPDYEVAPDGKTFISPCQEQDVRRRAITVVVQWTSLIRKRQAGN